MDTSQDPLPQRLQEAIAPPQVQPLLDEAWRTLVEIKSVAQNGTGRMEDRLATIIAIVNEGVKG